jgi:hypothetical protein
MMTLYGHYIDKFSCIFSTQFYLFIFFEISKEGFTNVKLRQLTFQERNEQIKIMDR